MVKLCCEDTRLKNPNFREVNKFPTKGATPTNHGPCRPSPVCVYDPPRVEVLSCDREGICTRDTHYREYIRFPSQGASAMLSRENKFCRGIENNYHYGNCKYKY